MVKKKILIVDDDKHIRLSMVSHLQKGLNVECIEAENGKEGLAKILVEKPDLVLLDVNMPVMDGFEVLNKIRRSSIETLKKIPIIMLTGTAEKSVVLHILKMGISGYLKKPVNSRKAIEQIKQILGPDDDEFSFNLPDVENLDL
ncbi:response regulator [candidate division KSB1 bacterium]